MSRSETTEPPSTRPDGSRPRIGVVILAAGQGTRMRSRLPKVVHPVAGLPMVRQVVELGRTLQATVTALVVGHAAEEVVAAAGEGVEIVHQAEQLGTGHAVLQARDVLCGRADVVVVLYADTALVRPETLGSMVAATERAAAVLMTATADDTRGYSRVKRADDGRVLALIELRDGVPEHEAIREFWGGAVAYRAEWLWEEIGRLRPSPIGEIFLTDLVAIAAEGGHQVDTVPVTDISETWGVNTQAQLAEVNRIALERLRRKLMDDGVRMTDPSSVYVDSTVVVEADVVLEPNTHLQGRTRVAAGTVVGPNSIVRDTTIGRDCRVVASVLEEAWVGNEVQIGPFAHLRPGARIEDRVELGNYAEVKASTIGGSSRIHHFSYIGDAQIGRDVNIGAGTITMNYDGKTKHPTIVGDRAFIGSDTLLRAPVTVGEDATTGAGSVVTRDVAPGQLVVGMPARPVPGRGGDRAPGGSPSSGETSPGEASSDEAGSGEAGSAPDG